MYDTIGKSVLIRSPNPERRTARSLLYLHANILTGLFVTLDYTTTNIKLTQRGAVVIFSTIGRSFSKGHDFILTCMRGSGTFCQRGSNSDL